MRYAQPQFAAVPGVVVLLVSMAGAVAAHAESTCEASPAVQSVLAALSADDLLAPQEREKLLKELLVKHPDDLFVHEAYSDHLSGPLLDYAGALERYRKLEEAQPAQSNWTFLRARLVSYAKRVDAISLLDSIVASDPAFARAHLFLAEQHHAAKEAKKAKEELDLFFHLCPDSVEGYGLLLRLPGDRVLAPYASRLRQTLLSRQDPAAFAAYSTLWKLEFQATPVARHPPLRKRVAADVGRIRAAVPEPDARLLSVLEEGYKLSEDADGQKWVSAQRTDARGTDRHAFFEEYMSWQRTHPYPAKADAALGDAYKKALFDASGEWVKRLPREAMAWTLRLSSAPRDLPVEEVKAICDKILAIGDSMAAVRVASIYAERKINLDRVPAMVTQGLENRERELANMRAQPERFGPALKMMESDSGFRFGMWSTLATAYFHLGDAARLGEAVEQMKHALDAPPATTVQDSSLGMTTAQLQRMRNSRESRYWRARANLARLGNHKADAVGYLLRARSPEGTDDGEDSPTDEARRLWKELGGSDDGWVVLAAREQPKTSLETATESEWTNKEVPLPPFALSDLRGRVWKSSELKGKALILVTWATWCAPCKQELPYVEKLYQRTKKRKDLAILSLNVDEEVGLVQPFVAETKYSFPILLASDYSRALGPRGIPQLWIADAKGIIRLERIGFDHRRTTWVDDTLAAAEKIAQR